MKDFEELMEQVARKHHFIESQQNKIMKKLEAHS